MARMELQPREGPGIQPLSLRRQSFPFPLSRPYAVSKDESVCGDPPSTVGVMARGATAVHFRDSGRG